MILFPPAKINLGLQLLFKRNDGFHELETCMVSTSLTDILEILPSSEFEFKQTGLEIPGNNIDNLCIRAYNLIKDHCTIPPVSIHLRKIIPMGAGLGGGSADAAYMLTGLNELFKLELSKKTLQQLAAQLGSDCAFFIQGNPQLAKGRGEILTDIPLNLKGYYLKLINPGIHVSTKEAFAGAVFYDNKKPVSEIVQQSIASWKDELENDFEKTVFATYPVLHELKIALYQEGAVYAAMSGSGSTLFGIFDSEPHLTYTDQKKMFEYISQL